MGTFLVISFICIINIILWGVFLVKFKRLFSTDDIRIELNKMIADINKNTAQDLTLIDNKMGEIRELLNIADRKIATVRKEAERKVEVETITNKIESVINEKKEQILPPKVQQAYVRVPVYTPKVTLSEKPIEQKKQPLGVTINELYNAGLSVEEIARKIGKTTTEVSMIMDMNL